MTHRYTPLLALLLIGRMAGAQCIVPVPNNLIVFTEDDSSTSVIQQAILLCSGTYVSASSIDPVIFLENGAHMNFSGISKNIYAKAGSIVDGSGIDDTIYYEVGAQLLIGGIDQTLIECDPLIFDFGPLGVSPCDFSSAVRERSGARFVIYPTITTEEVEVVRSHGNSPGLIQVFDRFGRLVLTRPMSGARSTLTVPHLATGTYSVVITDQHGRWSGRFMKE
jgi:hypothetical protein